MTETPEPKPTQISPEVVLVTTADRVRALASNISDEAIAAQSNNKLVKNAPREKFKRWFKNGGFKQNVELPLTEEEKRLVSAADGLRQLVNIIPTDTGVQSSESEPLVINYDDGSSLTIEENEGTVHLTVEGLSGQPGWHIISRADGVISNNPKSSVPFRAVGYLSQALEHFSPPSTVG